jgi:hypothetical protein
MIGTKREEMVFSRDNIIGWLKWWWRDPKYAWQYMWREIRSQSRYIKQKATRGYSDIEVWNLNTYVAKYTLPRSKEYRRDLSGYPASQNDPDADTFEAWQKTVDKMIFALDAVAHEFDSDAGHDKLHDNQAEVREGLELFGKWFQNLWD